MLYRARDRSGSEEFGIEAGVRPGDLRDEAPPGPGWTSVVRWADELSDVIAGHQPAFHVGVFAYDPAVDALRLAAQVRGAGEEDDGVVVGQWLLEIDASVSGRVYQSGAPILIPDVDLDPDYRARPGSRTRSELILPVVAGDRIVAVASLEAPWVSAFTIEDYDRVRGQLEVIGPTFPVDAWS